MATSRWIAKWFGNLDNNANDVKYYGPYNTLLARLFPIKDHYFVCPDIVEMDTLYGPRPIMSYVIRYELGPVFFVVVEGLKNFGVERERADIDKYMRRRLTELQAEGTRLTRILGLSCMGPLFLLYQLRLPIRRTDPVEPRSMLDDDNDDNKAPQHWWKKNNILTLEGEERLMEIVEDVKGLAMEAHGK